MIKRIGIAMVLWGAGCIAQAETSLVVGRAVSQIDDVDIQLTPEETCPPESVCLRSWSRWTLNVKDTILGPAVKGRTYVVMMQHAPVVDSTFQKDLLFVLEHIDAASERQRLHADYKLLEMTEPEQMICMRTAPADLGVSSDVTYRQGKGEDATSCFRDPRTKRE
jgi:hypothetical protein